MKEEMAIYWIELYGIPAIEFTLAYAVKAWVKKVEREGLPIQ
jgi:hypothetical protein